MFKLKFKSKFKPILGYQYPTCLIIDSAAGRFSGLSDRSGLRDKKFLNFQVLNRLLSSKSMRTPKGKEPQITKWKEV
jgi:hypothetical protein